LALLNKYYGNRIKEDEIGGKRAIYGKKTEMLIMVLVRKSEKTTWKT
jgi:hypothetical protein